MSHLGELIKGLNLTPDQISELINAARTNPMAAMGVIQKLQIPPTFFQQVLAIMMTNPNALSELGQEFGLGQDTVDEMKNRVQGAIDQMAGSTADRSPQD